MFTRTIAPPGPNIRRLLLALSLILLTLAAGAEAWAHNVAAGDKGYIQESTGVLFWPFVYLGAKHMVTGYDQRFREFSKRQHLGTDRHSYTAPVGAIEPAPKTVLPSENAARRSGPIAIAKPTSTAGFWK